MDLELLKTRSEIIRQVRSFFDRRDYLETDTPLLSPDLIPESCLEVFETSRLPPPGARRKEKPFWLIPSPEIWIKRLIAEHRVSMYQICKCFRNGESSGHLHSPEFTMLEYYTMQATYKDSLYLTELLISSLRTPPSSLLPILTITMEEAFFRWAGFDLYEKAESPEAMEQEGRRLGLEPPPGLTVPQLYDLIFIHAVEPNLPKDRLTALMDYPAFVPCLAKKNPDGKTVQRWELYARGVELANCYSEETDPGEVKKFFENETAEKEKTALVRHKVDGDYWKTFLPRGQADGSEQPWPECSGVALGLDRLIMILTGRSTIDAVLPFPMD
jgi:lysyl-tRNA synthetase class 2